MPHIVIVGAGISGLALGYRLQQQLPLAEITILEKNDRPGGTIATLERDGFRVEAGPNGFLDTKPSTIELCRDLGLQDRLVAASEAAAKNRFLFFGDKLKLLPNGFMSFFKSDLLSWKAKVSLLSERFRASLAEEADESIFDFFRRRTHHEVAEVLADALVTGIFAGDPKLLSAAACFPRFVQMERQFGSILKGMTQTAKQRRREAMSRGEKYTRGGRMWSFREGMGLLIDTLHSKLKKPPILGVHVNSIERIRREKQNETAWKLIVDGGSEIHADAVVLTSPAYSQAAILRRLDRAMAGEIGAIAYNRVAVVALGYRRDDIQMSLSGFGFIAPQHTRRDVLGVQWCSSIFPGRAPDRSVLLRAMCGGWHRGDIVDWEDGRLLAAVRGELRLAMHITAEPMFTQIVRWDRAIPQYLVGHNERVKSIEKKIEFHPGLFLGGNAFHGVAMNDCTEQAANLAEKVMSYVNSIKQRAGREEKE